MARRIGKRQTIQWLGEQGKDRQYNDQENREKTDNTMTRRIGKRQTIQWLGEQGKDRQYNGQENREKDKQCLTKHYTEN